MNCEHETLNKIMNSNYIWHKIYLFSVGILFNWRLLRNARGVWVVWWLDLFLFHVCLCIHYRVEWVWALVCVWRFACLCFVISIINNMWKQKSDSPTEPNRIKNPKTPPNIQSTRNSPNSHTQQMNHGAANFFTSHISCLNEFSDESVE